MIDLSSASPTANFHNVESTGAPGFTSSLVTTTGTYQLQFTAAGSYSYTCSVHATMTGVIVVR